MDGTVTDDGPDGRDTRMTKVRALIDYDWAASFAGDGAVDDEWWRGGR